MASLNKAQIIGNLTRDPELKTTNSGSQLVNLAVATNYKTKESEKVEYHNVTLWGKLADVANNYLSKGSKVFIEGRIETQSWESEGKKMYRTHIIGQQLIMLNKVEKKTEVTTSPSNEPIDIDDLPF